MTHARKQQTYCSQCITPHRFYNYYMLDFNNRKWSEMSCRAVNWFCSYSGPRSRVEWVHSSIGLSQFVKHLANEINTSQYYVNMLRLLKSWGLFYFYFIKPQVYFKSGYIYSNLGSFRQCIQCIAYNILSIYILL